MADIVKRSGKLPYYEVGEAFCKMTGFTELSTSKKPIEYSRRYIDENFERNDVVGYSTQISYSFDMFTGNSVHEDMASIADGELIGTDAVRNIVLVDFTKKNTSGAYSAVKRSFSIIPDTEGDSTDAYTYSGTMKAAGDIIKGTVTSSDDFATVTFTAEN